MSLYESEVLNIDWNDKGALTDTKRQQLLEFAIDTYGKQLTSFAYTLVKDWGRAEDIVQEVFISFYSQIHSFRGEASLKTWLYTIARNKSIDHLRSWSIKNIFIQFNGDEETKANLLLEGNSAMEEKKWELSLKVLALPIKYREVIILHYYESFSIEEISELTKTKEATIRTRLKRAKKQLKEAFERGGMDGQ